MDFAQRLKSSVDIVSVVGEYVRLRKAGPRHVGLCPFHPEKTPSFSVHSAHQFYKCFGCGAGGDVIHFVMQLEGLTFWEALKHLAEKNGIPLPKRDLQADPESKLRASLQDIHEAAAELLRQCLLSPAGAAARSYLKNRGVSEDVAAQFGLGYTEPGGQFLLQHLRRRGFADELLETSGLVLRRHEGTGHFDRFRGRLMFPIHNESGKVIAFAGRALRPDDEPKYLNSPETPIYRKSYVLYNLHRARSEVRQQDHAILVEGYMDVIGLHAAGVREVVASCGTALTAQQVRSLKRHAQRIVVNFDPDAAGAGAAERSIQMLLTEGMHVRILELPEGLDPDEFVRSAGAADYRARLKKAAGYFYWLADRARAKYDMQIAEERMTGFREMLLPALQLVPDALEQAALAGDVAAYLGVDQAMVLRHFRRTSSARTADSPRSSADALKPAEKLLIHELLCNPEARRAVLPKWAATEIPRGLASGGILQAMAQLQAAQENWSYADLEARLTEQDRSVLATLAFADLPPAEPDSAKQALECLRRLEAAGPEALRAELHAQVKSAERAGNLEEALRLTREIERLPRG